MNQYFFVRNLLASLHSPKRASLTGSRKIRMEGTCRSREDAPGQGIGRRPARCSNRFAQATGRDSDEPGVKIAAYFADSVNTEPRLQKLRISKKKRVMTGNLLQLRAGGRKSVHLPQRGTSLTSTCNAPVLTHCRGNESGAEHFRPVSPLKKCIPMHCLGGVPYRGNPGPPKAGCTSAESRASRMQRSIIHSAAAKPDSLRGSGKFSTPCISPGLKHSLKCRENPYFDDPPTLIPASTGLPGRQPHGR